MLSPELEPSFQRDTGCTEDDWLRWLPGACSGHELTLPAPDTARIVIGDGSLVLRWRVLPPRRLGLASLPRLLVDYAFDGLTADQQAGFMRGFDLYMHRGGG